MQSIAWSIGDGERGIKQAVSAYFRNDPYFPKPGRVPPELWDFFVEGYEATAREIIGGQLKWSTASKLFMPLMFIHSVEEEQKR